MHSDIEYRPIEFPVSHLCRIVNWVVARQSTDWLAANAQFSTNNKTHKAKWLELKENEWRNSVTILQFMGSIVLQGRVTLR